MSIESPKFAATLIRGEVWYHQDIRFEKNVPMCISEAIKEHMEEHAVDEITTTDTTEDEEGYVEIEVIAKHKFDYQPYDGPALVGQPITAAVAVVRKIEPAKAPAPRNRTRSR